MEVEKRSLKGGFLQLFDWNIKSRKKLFSNKSELPGMFSKNVSADGTNTSNSYSKVSLSSIPQTPRDEDEGEILQSSNLKSFTFSESKLKAVTRNFSPDSVLRRGGFGSVYKGSVDESSLAASNPGSRMVVAVKRLN